MGVSKYSNDNHQFKILPTAFSEQTAKYNVCLYFCLYGRSKCYCMQFTQAKFYHINKVYYLHDIALVFSDHCKYLGATLQPNFKVDGPSL